MYEDLINKLRELPHLLFVQLGEHEDVVYQAADVIEEEDMAFRHLERDYKELCDHLPQWIPVAERLPEPGWYLVRCNEMLKHVHRIAYYCNSAWYEDCNNITKFVIHWMLLPEQPKEENQ